MQLCVNTQVAWKVTISAHNDATMDAMVKEPHPMQLGGGGGIFNQRPRNFLFGILTKDALAVSILVMYTIIKVQYQFKRSTDKWSIV